MSHKIRSFIAKEWLFWLSLVLWIASSLLLHRIPHYSSDEFEVLFILFMLFIAIKGLENSGLLRFVAIKIEQGIYPSFALVLATFLISLFVTNDVALIVMVPITLLLNIPKKAYLIIIEAIAANGAALLPCSNPQNLYIFWHYNLSLQEFVRAIFPFVLFIFLFSLLLVAILRIKVVSDKEVIIKPPTRKAKEFLFLFLLVVAAVIKMVPLFLAFIVFFYALFRDPKSLQIDYYLLATFFLFFGIADNTSFFFQKEIAKIHDIFWLSLILSQLISNVPASVVVANFTQQWQPLLWGVSVGGYGILWGSLANIIAYKFYSAKYKEPLFLLRFMVLNFITLILGACLWYLVGAS